MLEGDLRQRVARARGVEQIAAEQGVERNPSQGDAVPREQDRVLLQVVSELVDRRVLEQRLQPAEHGCQFQLHRPAGGTEQIAGVVAARVAHWHVGGVPVRHCERDTDDCRAYSRYVVGHDPEAELAGRSQPVSQRVQRLGRRHELVLVRRGRHRRRVVVDQGSERQLGEQLIAALAVGAAVGERRQIHFERHVGADRHELAASERVVPMLDEGLPLLALELCRRRVEQRVETAEAGHEVDRAFLADAGYAGYVVACIADERQHVDHLRWPHAEFLDDARLVEPGTVFPRVVHLYVRVGHELEEVLVDRHDRDVVPRGHGPDGERADHVVGFVARRREDGHAHRLARLVYPGDLFGQVIGHRGAVGLVIADDVVAKRLAPEVERRGDERRCVIGHELAQHGHEEIDRVRRRAFLVGQAAAAHRVIRTVHLRAAVYQEEPWAGHENASEGYH